MPRKDLPFVQRFIDRHGRLRFYFRKPGHKRIALPGPYGGAEFLAAYQAASEGAPLEIGAARTTPGTMNALVVSFYKSPGFISLRPSTERVYRNIIERFRNEHGHKSVAGMQARHVRAIVAAKASTPDAANRLLGMISLLMDHAVAEAIRPDNPAFGIKRLRHKSDGFVTWSEEDIATFRAHWPLGSRERLGLELALGTGQRRGDLVRLGWQNLGSGAINLKQSKTGAVVAIPVVPELRAALDLLSRDRLTFIATSTGAPYTPAGLGNWFREAVRDAGLSDELSLHGLRKAAARRLAEAGCTTHEIASVTGHSTLSEIERYTRAAEKARLARTASAKVIRAFGRKGEE
ncbi:MAG: tyrosine-type recombinase/integrase [Methylocystis sp.]|jgi:integrase